MPEGRDLGGGESARHYEDVTSHASSRQCHEDESQDEGVIQSVPSYLCYKEPQTSGIAT